MTERIAFASPFERVLPDGARCGLCAGRPDRFGKDWSMKATSTAQRERSVVHLELEIPSPKRAEDGASSRSATSSSSSRRGTENLQPQPEDARPASSSTCVSRARSTPSPRARRHRSSPVRHNVRLRLQRRLVNDKVTPPSSLSLTANHCFDPGLGDDSRGLLRLQDLVCTPGSRFPARSRFDASGHDAGSDFTLSASALPAGRTLLGGHRDAAPERSCIACRPLPRRSMSRAARYSAPT